MSYSYRKKLAGTAVGALLVAAFCGCGSSNDVAGGGGFLGGSLNPISPILRAPVANDDNINAIGNATLNQALGGGVLSNDELNGASISSFDTTSANGGTVNLNDNGSFTYTPAANFSGPDSFTYTLTNTLGSSTATVNLAVNGRAFFVDTSAANNGSGAQGSPFNAISSALNAVAPGDTIFVLGTSGTINGAIDLPQGVNLIGQGVGLILAQTVEPVGDRPTLTGPINAGGANTISGFTIDGSGTSGILADTVTDIIIDNNVFADHADHHVVLNNVSGGISVTNNVFNSLAGTGAEHIDVDNDGTTSNFVFDNNQFVDDVAGNVQSVLGDFSGNSVISLAFRNNATSSSNVRSLFYFDTNDNSQVTLEATNNFVDDATVAMGFATQSSGASVTATFSGNLIDEASEGIGADANAGTITVSCTTNNFETCSRGVDLATGGTNGSINATITGNRFFECSPGVRAVVDGTGGNINVALRDNEIDNDIQFRTENDGVLCADITGNTFVDRGDAEFTNNGGTLNVERLDNSVAGGPLESVNVFSGGMVDLTGTVTPRDAGFCQIP